MIEFFKTVVLLLESIDRKISALFGANLPAERLITEDFDVDKLLTRMMVVAKLRISERTYNRWVKSGLLTPIYVGNKHFYREEDLEAALQRSINRGRI